MSYLLQMPMKFECGHCHQMYLHTYQYTDHHCPECPTCRDQGLLMGVAEWDDLLQHPIVFAKSYLRQTWHMLNKPHS